MSGVAVLAALAVPATAAITGPAISAKQIGGQLVINYARFQGSSDVTISVTLVSTVLPVTTSHALQGTGQSDSFKRGSKSAMSRAKRGTHWRGKGRSNRRGGGSKSVGIPSDVSGKVKVSATSSTGRRASTTATVDGATTATATTSTAGAGDDGWVQGADTSSAGTATGTTSTGSTTAKTTGTKTTATNKSTTAKTATGSATTTSGTSGTGTGSGTTSQQSSTATGTTGTGTTGGTTSTAGLDVKTVYMTGYGYPDNDPPGSAAIAYPKVHQKAAGTGTYADPITVAVAVGGAYKAGQYMYFPELKRYGLVEDSCARCKSTQVDIWTGGDGSDDAAVLACENKLTGDRQMILDPPQGLAVDVGGVSKSTFCTGGSSSGTSGNGSRDQTPGNRSVPAN